MVQQPVRGRRVLGVVLLLAGLSITSAVGTAAPPGATSAPLAGRLAAAEARLAWHVSLELKFTASIRSCSLVDEYLYVVSSDGMVRAIRADIGELAWSRPVAEPQTALWPPVAYHDGDVNGVVFSRVDDVLFLDPATGENLQVQEQTAKGTKRITIAPVRLRSAAIAPAVTTPRYVFSVAPGGRARRYLIADGQDSWEIDARDRIRLAPIYLAQQDTVLVAGVHGALIGITATARKSKVEQGLVGEPVGWLATDEVGIYVSTSAARLYALDARTGQVLDLFPYRLPGWPAGGPVVTVKSIYQAIADGGVQRVGKELEWPNWFVGDARMFLAEWPRQVALLLQDDRIALVKRETGDLEATIDLGGKFTGVSNPRNDATILVSPDGEVYCLRPVGAKPLAAVDFRPPPTSQPAELAAATRPASTMPAGEMASAAGEKPAGGRSAEELAAEAKASAEKAAGVAASQPMTLEEQLIANPLRTRWAGK